MEKKQKLRFEETRVTETRNYDEAINFIKRKNVGSLDIPQEIIPPGVVYKWVLHSVYKSGDVPISNKLANATKAGWDPVPYSRHPEIVTFDPMNRDSHLREFIYRDGLILCERPKWVDDAQKAEEEREARQAMNYVNQYDKSTPYGGLNIDTNRVTRGLDF